MKDPEPQKEDGNENANANAKKSAQPKAPGQHLLEAAETLME